jgi:hypothetical protein
LIFTYGFIFAYSMTRPPGTLPPKFPTGERCAAPTAGCPGAQ